MIRTKLLSKRVRLALGLTLLCLVLVTGVVLAIANAYTLNWNVVSGGGQVSAGGKYSLSGTIGQGDVGSPMTGGSGSKVYTLSGGYWVGIPSTLVYFPAVKK
jgi:uncharacterized membrane protein YbjE (DUF340 family)